MSVQRLDLSPPCEGGQGGGPGAIYYRTQKVISLDRDAEEISEVSSVIDGRISMGSVRGAH